MLLVEDGSISPGVQWSPEYLYLPGDAGLDEASRTTWPDKPTMLAEVELEKPTDESDARMRLVASEALSIMGLDRALTPATDDRSVIRKSHRFVSEREAAVAEQFFHIDKASGSFCGVLMVGLDGDYESVPDTQMINNAVFLEFVEQHVSDGPLQDRLDEVFVVRPVRDCYQRHVLSRLARSPFRELLSPAQLEHADRATRPEAGLDTTRYIDDVQISTLIDNGVIDGTPLVTCSASTREIRLALGDTQSEE